MQCPACQSDLVIVEHSGVELDLCIDGHGTWFDADELSMLAEREHLSDFMRSLERELPAATTKCQRRCPRCRSRMQHVEVPAHPNPVILDRCRHGHGLWFDPGELSSILKNHLESEDAGLHHLQAFLGEFAAPLDTSPLDSNQEN